MWAGRRLALSPALSREREREWVVIPACAGMTKQNPWTLACAGVTMRDAGVTREVRHSVVTKQTRSKPCATDVFVR